MSASADSAAETNSKMQRSRPYSTVPYAGRRRCIQLPRMRSETIRRSSKSHNSLRALT